MNARRLRHTILTGSVLTALAGPLADAQLGNLMNQSGAGQGLGGLGNLGGMGSGLPGGSLLANTSGNAAGILTFCIKNNYLGGGTASGVRDSLMGKLGDRTASSDPGYLDGASGLLHGGNGQQVSLAGAGTGGLKAEITRKVCDQVLNQAKSML
jgi:hypothetical protein